ncbi:MAG: hypothetical protein WC934_11325 [Acidithiobacillus sp.]|jgi:hypothetical protein|uniref:hypothetical protein n=1 Tax=Acidithiobacillus sp. TaxID=1872118 RepID=UPI00355F5B2D
MAEKNAINRVGTTPNTRLVNTHKVKVYGFSDVESGLIQIGLIQDWSPSDSRSNTPVRGIGYGDQIAEIAVGPTDITASCGIMAMYLKNIMQIFGFKAGSTGIVRSLKHHRWPFDVYEEIVLPDFAASKASNSQTSMAISGLGRSTGNKKALATYYEGCWMNSYARGYGIGDVSVNETCDLIITDVYEPGRQAEYGEDLDDFNTANQSAAFANS